MVINTTITMVTCPSPLQAMSSELSPFMCSGAHLSQMDSHPSAVGAFLEGVFKCDPQPHIKSCILKVI